MCDIAVALCKPENVPHAHRKSLPKWVPHPYRNLRLHIAPPQVAAAHRKSCFGHTASIKKLLRTLRPKEADGSKSKNSLLKKNRNLLFWLSNFESIPEKVGQNQVLLYKSSLFLWTTSKMGFSKWKFQHSVECTRFYLKLVTKQARSNLIFSWSKHLINLRITSGSLPFVAGTSFQWRGSENLR